MCEKLLKEIATRFIKLGKTFQTMTFYENQKIGGWGVYM
jgi:hypothetical protein